MPVLVAAELQVLEELRLGRFRIRKRPWLPPLLIPPEARPAVAEEGPTPQLPSLEVGETLSKSRKEQQERLERNFNPKLASDAAERQRSVLTTKHVSALSSLIQLPTETRVKCHACTTVRTASDCLD